VALKFLRILKIKYALPYSLGKYDVILLGELDVIPLVLGG
jgi:hypothetical protein